jgi:hypothetical protein
MPKFGKAAVNTALPQPPSTNTNVPINSAVTLLRIDMIFLQAIAKI